MVLRPGAEPGVEGYWEDNVDETGNRSPSNRPIVRSETSISPEMQELRANIEFSVR